MRRRIRIAASISIRSSRAEVVHDDGRIEDNRTVPHDGKEMPSFGEWDFEDGFWVSSMTSKFRIVLWYLVLLGAEIKYRGSLQLWYR